MRRGNASAPPRVSGRQGQRDADAEAQLSRLGLVLAVLAVAANGCVQPDEWFQSVEIAARDVFGAKIWTPWEFGGSAALGDAVHEPCRSVSFPAVAAHAPLFLLRLCGGSIAWPRLIMMIPRLWALVISILVHDRLLGEVWRAAGLDDEGVRVARALRRTSWACLVLETRPFSNVYETFGLALCARLAAEGRSAALGAATAVVCWWRFDFAAFAAPLGLYCVASSSKSTAKAIATGLATFAAGAGLLVLGDTLYFNSIDGSVVVAPWRNFLFNASTENLRRFGLHPRWFHLVVNAPFLYGPLLLFLGGARKRNPFGKALDASAVLGLAALSVAPHQEPRFLLPTACAVFARAAPRVARLKWKRKFYVFWLVFHLAVAGFYTTIHQAGLVPLLRRVGAARGACDHVAFVGTYLPPYSVAGPRAGAELFLHDFENDAAGLGRRVAALKRELDGGAYGRCASRRLYVAVAAPALPAARAAFPRLGAAVASFAPHFSGELPPASFSQLVLGLYEARF